MTLLVAGVIALVQWDIKRVIAYSTMSQIGYMFLAAGIGAYDFAMFHLMTHAFFKALLFLAAGLVIHHLAGEQDIRKMGGLRASMPFTRVDVPDRRARARGHPAALRLLVEGRDHRLGARRRRRARLDALRRRAGSGRSSPASTPSGSTSSSSTASRRVVSTARGHGAAGTASGARARATATARARGRC